MLCATFVFSESHLAGSAGAPVRADTLLPKDLRCDPSSFGRLFLRPRVTACVGAQRQGADGAGGASLRSQGGGTQESGGSAEFGFDQGGGFDGGDDDGDNWGGENWGATSYTDEVRACRH